ncbi:MAG: DUF5010 domain-containing protein [Chloroflexia bacterium]|nr:DUF5010 domain-containing protein [Chloroflexia bacterium]
MNKPDCGVQHPSTPKCSPCPARRPWRVLWLLPLLFLLSCLPSLPPDRTPASTAVPTTSPDLPATPSALSSVPPGPTWTSWPSSSPLPWPSSVPAWPTAQPTPSLAPLRRPELQVGTFFFFWHDCPDHLCDPRLVYALPPGWDEPLSGDPDPADGLYYSSRNRYWYLQELRDMRLAGIEIILPVSWGDTRHPWFCTEQLRLLVEANRQLDPPLRIALFDDTTSERYEYHDYADNRLLDYSNYGPDGPPLDLNDPASGFYFYDRKIRPFFQLVPQEMWATHNGRPLEQGGRPLIVVYTAAGMSNLHKAGSLWASIKESFRRDFQDRDGRPITPWLVLENSWFTPDTMGGRPPVSDAADGQYLWGTALHGPDVRDWREYTVASVGPGFDNSNLRWPDPGQVQPRYRDPPGGSGDPGTFLRWSLQQVPARTDLLLIETWNELWEGTSVCRADYLPVEGQAVPEDYWLNLLRGYLTGQELWWAAQPLPAQWATRLAPGQHYQLALEVHNTGTRTWSGRGGEHLLLGGDLFPQGYVARLAEPVRPGELARFTVPITTPLEFGSYGLSGQMYGPKGAFGPAVLWPLQVGQPQLGTNLVLALPSEPIRAGVPFVLDLQLEPALPLQRAQLRLRFDPQALQLLQMEALPGQVPRQWQAQVDNERGLLWIELQANETGPCSELLRLHLLGRQAASSGLWIEESQLWLPDGLALVLEADWTELIVGAAP